MVAGAFDCHCEGDGQACCVHSFACRALHCLKPCQIAYYLLLSLLGVSDAVMGR